MIIDFHTHIFPDNLAEKAIAVLTGASRDAVNHTDGTLAALHQSMAVAGIDCSVTLPIATRPTQTLPIVNYCSVQNKENQRYRTMVVPFASIHPDQPADQVESILAQVSGLGIRGIKLHPEYQDFYIDDPRYFPLYDALQALDLIVVFHAGRDPGRPTGDHVLPASLKKVRRTFPLLRMVAAHLGGWGEWQAAESELIGEDLFLDTSAVSQKLDRQVANRIIKNHGSGRILFGTDSPWFEQATEIAWIDSLDLSSAEKDAILGGNAQGLLGIA